MSKIWDDIRNEGKIEATVNSLHQIMENLKLSIEEAMKALNLPLEEIDFYKTKLLELQH